MKNEEQRLVDVLERDAGKQMEMVFGHVEV